MTPPDDLALLAARALARDSREPSRRASVVDPETVQRVAAAIRARKRGRRLQWIAGASTVAAAVLVTLGLSTKRPGVTVARGPATVVPEASAAIRALLTVRQPFTVVDSLIGAARLVHDDGTQPAVEGTWMRAGDELIVQPAAQLALSLPTGTHLGIEEGSDVTLLEEGSTQIFRLTAGAMRASVHKLANGERFLVKTVDAEVEVRGTSFRVSVAPASDGCASTTRVQVYEGVVTVRSESSERRVAAGEVWPSGCAAPGTAPSAPTPLPTAVASSPPTSGVTSSRLLERSQLAEQNDLYARAMSLRESGETEKSLRLFERLVATYPSSPLAENAAVERMKLLASTQNPVAGQAARDYLARYPTGFARRDAESIVSRERNPH